MKSTVTIVDYKHFDVLDPKYSILKFSEIPRGQRFRYNSRWRIKVGDKMAKSYSRNDNVGWTYLEISPDHFVLIFTHERPHTT